MNETYPLPHAALSSAKENNKPFAYFQWNYGWGHWEQVIDEAAGQEGVMPAYLAALPAPTGDVGEIAEALRKKVFRGPTMEAFHTKTVEWRAADALTAQAARIAELEALIEREKGCLTLAIKAARGLVEAAEARIAELERERDEAIGKAEGQWVGWVKSHVALKAAIARAERLAAALREIAAMDEVSVTDYDGVDGWKFQCKARAALSASQQEGT